MSEQLCGGFNSAQAPTQDQLDIFAKFQEQVVTQSNATGDVSVQSCSEQVVAGRNYKYVVKVGDKAFNVVIFQGLTSPEDLSLTSVTAQ